MTTYATYHNLHAKSNIIKRLKNTLSDRVAVNHCVVQQLLTAFEIELLELKCNIHSLDGIAKKCTNIIILQVIHLKGTAVMSISLLPRTK